MAAADKKRPMFETKQTSKLGSLDRKPAKRCEIQRRRVVLTCVDCKVDLVTVWFLPFSWRPKMPDRPCTPETLLGATRLSNEERPSPLDLMLRLPLGHRLDPPPFPLLHSLSKVRCLTSASLLSARQLSSAQPTFTAYSAYTRDTPAQSTAVAWHALHSPVHLSLSRNILLPCIRC